MSATLFFDFKPPINCRIQTDDATLFKILYGDLSGQLSAEELKTLRSFVVHLSDKYEGAEMVVPVFPVEKAILTICETLLRLKSQSTGRSADVVIETLEKIQSELRAVAAPIQMFYIGMV